MYLFKDVSEIKIPIKCKLCLSEIEFSITADEYKEIANFPFKKEFIHGTPKHKLIVDINRNLEIENFKIEDVIDKEVSYSEELTRQVLNEIDLNDEEIELYFLTTGRDAVSLGEMAILINKSKEECQKIADKFVEKGLFKEIIGATPHYHALPPYAALIKQLQNFHSYITNIKENAPIQLNESFSQLEAKTEGVRKLSDYVQFMDSLKSDALKKMYDQKKEFDGTISELEKIKEITDVISNIEGDTKEIMVTQVKNLKNQFVAINKKIYQIMAKQIDDLTNQFESIRVKISQNLQKLRLGVIQQTVEQVVQKVFTAKLKEITTSLNRQLKTIQQTFAEGLKKTVESFNNQLIMKIRDSVGNIVKKVDGITVGAEKSGENIKNIFSSVSKQFSKAVIMAEEKLGGISQSIFHSFGDLKSTFSEKVIATLNEELENILKKLEISEITTNEFWEQAKRSSLFTMQDIWFIRSKEGAKAHINDEITKAKMRLLIVTPQLTDIDVNILKQCPKHINIRIATFINPISKEHSAILEELDKMYNVSYRHRELQNLWGINRDYEEVILCVLSKTEIEGKEKIEIAGLGSIIQEHIKIFVPILEDAWVSAKKDILHAIKPISAKATIRKPSEVAGSQEQITSPLITPDSQGAPSKPPLTSAKPLIKTEESSTSAKAQKPSVKELLKKPLKAPITQTQKPVQKPIAESQQPISGIPDSSGLSGDELLKNEFDNIIKNLTKMSGAQISSYFLKMQNDITEIRGYSAVLKQINLSANSLASNPAKLGRNEAEQLKKKISFWRKKLHL
ncbi:MAG: hypothetical protein ACTSQJ_05705 [Promethearchaeota archaeon]